MIATIVSAVALVAFAAFASRRLLSYLHIYQQDEYDAGRFVRWLFATGSFDRKVSLALLVIGIAALARPLGEGTAPVAAGLAAAVLAAAAALERDPRKVAKKKLVMTTRAKRIFGLALAIAAVVGAIFVFAVPVLGWIVPVELVPFALAAANSSLMPVERSVQNRYWREAHAKVLSLKPTVIGVTGSFGKTSLKHILGHVLQMAAPTLITPGSVNTPMGVARIVRESLEPRHRFFVVEMGAYGPGSIERLCALVPPAFGVITTIGKAHYERYKSLDVVAAAKFELAHAAQRNGGKVVTWTDTLIFPAGRAFAQTYPDSLVTCGGDGAALTLRDSRATAAGVSVDVVWQGTAYTLSAPLYGSHHGENIALAFAAACTLGLAPEDIQLALRSVPQIAHRLELKPQPNGSVLIDDAYNSNPKGFQAALEILGTLQKPGGRRILVTPGMVELGAAHEEEHERIGALAARYVDVLLAVAPARIGALVAAYAAAAPQGEVIPCATFAAAQAWLAANLTGADAVLLENDLPDLFERKMRL